jgi:hypothetical protein
MPAASPIIQATSTPMPKKNDQLRLDRAAPFERLEGPGGRKEKLDPEPDVEGNMLGGGFQKGHGPESCIPARLSRLRSVSSERAMRPDPRYPHSVL